MGKQVWNNHYKLQIIDEISQLIKRDIVNAGATPDSRSHFKIFGGTTILPSSAIIPHLCFVLSFAVPFHYSAALSLAITSSSNFTMNVVPLCQCADTCNKIISKDLDKQHLSRKVGPVQHCFDNASHKCRTVETSLILEGRI